MIGYRRAKKALGRLPRSLEVSILLASAAAIVVVGPLRGPFEAYPIVPFAGALFLFVMPGLLVSHWFFGDRFSGAAVVTVAFVISAGILGLAGVPVLLAHLSFDAYLWVVGAVLAAFLAAAMIVAFRRRQPEEKDAATHETSSRWL